METLVNMLETGRKIRKYMQQNGYSVKMLQEYLCLSCPQPIYRWFKGKNLPTVEHLYRLSRLFGVHMEDLLADGDDIKIEYDIYPVSARYPRMRAYYEFFRRHVA